jgi:pilus assembly protein CpaF
MINEAQAAEMRKSIALLEAQVTLMVRAQSNNSRSIEEDVPIDLSDALVKSIAALAPLKPLLDDDSINDILINGPKSVFVERAGKLVQVDVAFSSDAEVFGIAKAIAAQAGRHLGAQRPLLDARLPDGSRVNVIGPPLSVDGTSISIRKFAKRSVTLDQMVEQENMSATLAEFLKIVAKCRLNIIVSGGTGSGKTTLLNAISQYINPDERIVTIEDAAELKLQQPHVVRLETKPMVIGRDRAEAVSIRDLTMNALRMRPDRIIVGEVRGSEAFDMMQAMNTGHEGSLTTIHANHPRDALARIENMINMANLGLPSSAVRQQIASAVHLIIQVSRMRDGHRRITYISEVVGMEGDTITMQELFSFQPRAERSDGRLIGDFKWSLIMPRFLRRIAYYGESDHMAQVLGVKMPKF